MFGDYTFDKVHSFVYLSSLVTALKNVGLEDRRLIISVNRCYFGLREHFKSLVLSRNTKIS